jgi:hypothetical protein
MPFKRSLQILTLLVALGGYTPSPGAGSPLDFRLEELRSAEMEALDRFIGTPSFVVFFEPRCSWCAKQIATLEKLQESCPGQFCALAIGVHGDLPGYRRFVRRAAVGLPAYRGSAQLKAAIGGVPATPYTLFLDAGGKPTHRLRGAISAPQLRRWLADQGIDCAAQSSSSLATPPQQTSAGRGETTISNPGY